MPLVLAGPTMASTYAKHLGMGVFMSESWKPRLGPVMNHTGCRVWQVGERICGVDSLHCGVLGELI